MPVLSDQKIGTRVWRKREARRLRRDRKIYRLLRDRVRLAEKMHALADEEIVGFSVYVGKEGYSPAPGMPPELTPFPITSQENGRRIPRWEDLSQWMKVQVAAAAFVKEFSAYNMRLHPDLEDRWVRGGQATADVRAKLMERMRKELNIAVGPEREFFFVVEGWSKQTRRPTYLHVHGGVAFLADGDREDAEAAIMRALGHDPGNPAAIPRSVHRSVFHVEQAAYATYLFKAAKRPDARMTHRRFAMSHSMTKTARMFWELITRPSDEWRETSPS